MSNFNIRINGDARLGPARAEFAKLQAQIEAVNASMERHIKVAGGVNPTGYAQMAEAVKRNSLVTRNAALSTGQFEVQQLRLNSATETYTELIQKQKLTFRDMWKERKKGAQSIAKAAFREQMALKQMVVQQQPGAIGGKKVLDVYIPSEVHKDFSSLREKIGFIRQELKAASTQMINWGKNTQWAGRQLMVGFTMPTLAFGAATGVLAYQVDKQMTRIQKVYDATASSLTDDNNKMMHVEEELARVRVNSLDTARVAAKQYGASITDTLDVQAELAATGLKGIALQESTTQVMRIAMLGEFDQQEALKTVIALQATMGYTASETADQLNYMNSIENATSLATEDFAKAIPIALGPLKQMGGDVQDLGLLLVAMKERGIEAGEGANAIKAMMQRLYRPSKQIREEWEKFTHTDITDIRDRNKGNVMGMLSDISDATQGLGRAELVPAIGGLIGSYQVGKINAVLQGLRDLKNGVGQTSKAMQINEQDTAQWAKTAETETSRWQKSVSGKFKATMESLKVELAAMGEPFLEMGTVILQGIQKVLEAFNNLPGGVKKAFAITAIGAALLGPLVMLTGLTANFGGNLLKMAVSAARVAGNLGLMNKETKAAELIGSLASKGFVTEGDSLAMLTNEMKLMTQAAREGAFAQEQLLASMTGMPAPTRVNPARENALNQMGFGAPITGLSPSDKDVDNNKKQSKWLTAGAASATVMAGSMAASMLWSNALVDNMAQWAMIVAMGAPAIAGIYTGVKASLPYLKRAGVAVIDGVAAGFDLASKGVVKFASGMKGGLGSILGMVSPLGWISIALAASAASVYLLNKALNKGRDNVREMYRDAQGLSEILGFTVSEVPTGVNSKGESVESQEGKVQKFREEYDYVTEQIRNATTEQQAFNYAMSQGMKVIHSGGTAVQAKEAVELALRAGRTKAEAERIILHFQPQMDFSNVENQLDQSFAQMQQHLDDSKFKKGEEPGWLDRWFAWEDKVMGRDDIDEPDWMQWSPDENEAERIVEEMSAAGTEAANAYVTAMDNGLDTASLQTEAQNILNQLNADIVNAPNAAQEQVAIEKREAFIASFVKGRVDDEKDYAHNLGLSATILGIMGDANMYVSTGTGKAANNAKDLADGFGKAANNASKMQEALDNTDWVDAYKSAMTDTQSAIGDIASDNFDDQMSDAMDKFTDAQNRRMDELQRRQEAASAAQDRRQENETNRFEKRWDRRKSAVEDAFDQRIKGVENAIEAEQKAEEIRQRIFEAEIQRMQRMAEMLNTNIDFNVAINTGELDEAAKIRNDMQAKETEWALGDAGDRASQASQKRTDRLENKSEKLSKMKDKRLEALDAIEEAERKSLERRQEREDKFLERQQQKREDALQTEIDNNIAAQQEIWDNRKAKLDKAIELFQAYVPKNEKDLRQHVARISKQYKDFNVDTKGKFNVTAVKIGDMLQANVKDAARAIRDEIQWAGVGDKIAKDMIRGAFGMSPEQFQKWLMTGKWPKGADISAPDYSGSGNGGDTVTSDLTPHGLGSANSNQQPHHHPRRHTGGIVNDKDGGSGGFRRGHPDEVNITALKGEGVLNREAMSNLGPTGFRQLNDGKTNTDIGPKHKANTGGAGGLVGLGLAGIFGAMMVRGMASTLTGAAYNSAKWREAENERQAAKSGSGTWAAGKAGSYSDRYFSKDQLKNAATIASVGKNMGMSKRDIEIGIMTAITESGLVNIHGGDRDSQGLFQQRPSQGWGTVAQVTDPEYAARKFFSVLKTIGGRGDMSPWMAAQSVQRSAFSDGSNYRQYWDNAIAIYEKGLTSSGGVDAGFVQGVGGMHRPVGGAVVQGIHDGYTGYPAIDIDVPNPPAAGAHPQVRAAADGKVTRSYDLVGNDGRVSNGGYYSYGRVIYIDHGPFETLYAHLSERYARAGQTVKGGAVIGRAGNTGHSYGDHLHFGAKGISPYDFPGLKKGAMNINTEGLYNLHKNEGVLTEDINDQFKKGVDRFAEGPNAQYNLYMNVNGANMDEDALVHKTMTALRRVEQRKPQSRTGK